MPTLKLNKLGLATAALFLATAHAQTYDPATSRLTLPTLVTGNAIFKDVVLKLNNVEVLSFQSPTASTTSTKTCQVTGGSLVINIDSSARKMSGTFTASANGLVALEYLALIQNAKTYNLASFANSTPMSIVGTISGGPAIAAGTHLSFTLDTFPSSFEVGGSFAVYEIANGISRSCS